MYVVYDIITTINVYQPQRVLTKLNGISKREYNRVYMYIGRRHNASTHESTRVVFAAIGWRTYRIKMTNFDVLC